MWSRFFPLFPDRASTMAGRVDALFFFLVVVSVFFIALIAAVLIAFSIRYRRRKAGDIGQAVHGGWAFEVIWTVVPLVLTMVMFVWGTTLYFSMSSPPPDTVDIYVVAKQWMFKFQHPSGPREIDELHVPRGRAVKLTMTSEDVIHDLYIPAFRIKADILPGRYTTLWFMATKTGTYQAWLAGGGGAGEGLSLAAAGEKLFKDLACVSCHRADAQGRGPVLQGLYGRPVKLTSGAVVTADDAYLRESILNPAAKVTEGFQPIMPTFQGLVTEEQVLQLIEYIKSLKATAPSTAPDAAKTADAPKK